MDEVALLCRAGKGIQRSFLSGKIAGFSGRKYLQRFNFQYVSKGAPGLQMFS